MWLIFNTIKFPFFYLERDENKTNASLKFIFIQINN
jgi:hypothetical protein